MKVLCVAITVVCVILAGCGGGGGGSAAIPLSDTLRRDNPGDQWVYRITGTATGPGGSIALNGTMTITVSGQTIQTPDGTTARVYLMGLSMSAAGTDWTSSARAYMVQAPDRTMW